MKQIKIAMTASDIPVRSDPLVLGSEDGDSPPLVWEKQTRRESPQPSQTSKQKRVRQVRDASASKLSCLLWSFGLVLQWSSFVCSKNGPLPLDFTLPLSR